MPQAQSHQRNLVIAALAAAIWGAVALTPWAKDALAAGQTRTVIASPKKEQIPVDEPQVAQSQRALGPGFKRIQTEHFVILSDGPGAWTRDKAQLLEITAERLAKVMNEMGLKFQPPRHKLMCVLIEDHDRFEAFAAAQDGVLARWIGGYYAVKTNRIVFFNPRTAPDFARADQDLEAARQQLRRAEDNADRARRKGEEQAENAYRFFAQSVRNQIERHESSIGDQAARSGASKTIHEAVHLLAFNCGLQMRSRAYPFWLSEGLATCFEPASEHDAKRGRFGPAHDVPVRDNELAHAIAQNSLIPLARFITLPEAPTGDAHAAGIMYAQAHSLFRFLYQRSPRAVGELFLDWSNLPPGDPKPARITELFEHRFGKINEVERAWRAWAATPARLVQATTD